MVAITFGDPAEDSILVTTFADTMNAANGLTAFREAVIEENGRDRPTTVALGVGTYTLDRADPSSLKLSGFSPDTATSNDLYILGDITILGAGLASTRIEYGFVVPQADRGISVFANENTNPAFSVVSGARPALERLKVSGREDESRSAAVENHGGTLKITETAFTDNLSSSSVLVEQRATEIQPDSIETPKTFAVSRTSELRKGGEIFGSGSGGVVEIEDSWFEGNAAALGGALAATGGTATLSNRLLIDNASFGSALTLHRGGRRAILDQGLDTTELTISWDPASFSHGQSAAFFNEGGLETLGDRPCTRYQSAVQRSGGRPAGRRGL
ncbi:MAG: hypothetical protein AAGC57_21315 [Pseudomonadota bacterium]